MKPMDQGAFGEKLKTVLSPSRPLQSPELLKGRDLQLNEIKKAWYQPGRQVFIYGYRGVGKTSLAHTAAHQIQSADADPIVLTCSGTTTFYATVRDMLSKCLRSDPRETKSTRTVGVGVNLGRLSGDFKESIEKGKAPLPTSMNEAIELADFIGRSHSTSPVVIIDEFDLLKEKVEQELFANFVKQVADQNVNLRLIYCGIGDSIDDLLRAHESVYRYFHPVKLDRLDFDPRLEIISTSCNSPSSSRSARVLGRRPRLARRRT